MTVNSLLYKSQYSSSLLGILDSGRNAGATSGSALANLLSTDGAGSSLLSSTNGSDTVSLALSGISSRFMDDLAKETANYLKDQPDLQNNYVLAVINGQDGQREVKVYRRSELVASQAKTEAGQTLLNSRLQKNPILCYSSTDQLPMETNPNDREAAELSERLNKFLKKNEKVLNFLEREGFSPFSTLSQNTLA